jgi:hypothetical protein
VDDSLVVFEYKLDPADDPQTVVGVGAQEPLLLSTDATPPFLFRTASGSWAFSDLALTVPEEGFYRVFLTGTIVAIGATTPLVVMFGVEYNGLLLTNVFTVARVATTTEPVSFTMTWIQRAIPAGDISFVVSHDSPAPATLQLESLVLAARLTTREELSAGNP